MKNIIFKFINFFIFLNLTNQLVLANQRESSHQPVSCFFKSISINQKEVSNNGIKKFTNSIIVTGLTIHELGINNITLELMPSGFSELGGELYESTHKEIIFNSIFSDSELSEPDFLNRVRILSKEIDDYGQLHVRRYKCKSDLK